MSHAEITEHDGVEENETVDQVLDEYHVRPEGVKVERVSRNAYEGRTEWLKVYGKRSDTVRGFDGEVRENERFVRLNEMPEPVAYEVLLGLAEAYGYDLEPK